MSTLTNLKWRYATKRMNGQKVPAEKLENILEAILLAPTSIGMQPFTVLVIEDAELFTDNELEADEEPITEEKDDIETFTEEKDDVPEEESKKNVDDDDELKESNTKNTIIDNEDCLYVDDTFFDEEQTDEKISQRVPDDERISLPILSKYEMVNIIATRAKQISLGAKVLLKNPGKLQAKELAELELKNKMTPLKIKRNLPNGRYEIWKISELKNIN